MSLASPRRRSVALYESTISAVYSISLERLSPPPPPPLYSNAFIWVGLCRTSYKCSVFFALRCGRFIFSFPCVFRGLFCLCVWLVLIAVFFSLFFALLVFSPLVGWLIITFSTHYTKVRISLRMTLLVEFSALFSLFFCMYLLVHLVCFFSLSLSIGRWLRRAATAATAPRPTVPAPRRWGRRRCRNLVEVQGQGFPGGRRRCRRGTAEVTILFLITC